MTPKDHIVELEGGVEWTHMQSKYILLIDDHAIFLSGMVMLINNNYPLVKVITAESLDESLSNTVDQVDLILLDITLMASNGIEGIPQLKQKWPNSIIMILSAATEPNVIRRAIINGAAGFISKRDATAKIVATIDLVLTGNYATHNDPYSKKLTPRQAEILDLLHEGLSNKNIADKLDLSYNTVRRHVQDILSHFDVTSRGEAVFLSKRKTSL